MADDVVLLQSAKADAAKKYAPLSVPAWFFSGDSITRGAGDTDQYRGFAIRAAENANIGHMGTPFFGEKGSSFISLRHLRLAGTQFTTHLLDFYGQNDYQASQSNATAATLETNDLIRWQSAANRQQVVYAATITPHATATSDGYGTATGQTTDSNDAARIARNTWLRAGAPCTLGPNWPTPVAIGTGGALLMGQPGHPLTGYFDLAAVVESSLNSGKWRAADRTVTDGAITTGTAILTSATAAFSSADIGIYVNVAGAGASAAVLSSPIASVQSATQATLGNNASATVTGAGVAINPWTADGTHPTARGHIAMAAAMDLNAAVVAHPPLVAREWVPMTFRPNGYNGGFKTGFLGGTARVQHKLLNNGHGYSHIRVAYTNIVGNFINASTVNVRASIEYESYCHQFTFGNSLTGVMPGGHPLLLSDPTAVDVKYRAATNYVWTRTYYAVATTSDQAPAGLTPVGANGEGNNYSSSGGADLTGGGWYTQPTTSGFSGSATVFSPLVILGKPTR